MAVAQVGSTSTDGSGFSTTVSLAKPTGTANGQLAIFGVIIYNTSTFTVPSGWTADFNGLNGSSNSRMLVAHRVLDGSETWPLVVTQSTANQIGGCVAVFSGASSTLDVGTLANANTAAITLGAVTLTAANGALLGIVGQTHGNSGSIAFSASMANDGDSPGGANADIHFGFQTLSSSGSTSSRTGTYTTSGGYTLMGLLVGIEPSTSNTATGSLTLGGSAAWQASAAGSVSLTGAPSAKAAASSTGAVALSGTAAFRAAATGSLSLSATAIPKASAAATGSLSLSGTAAFVATPAAGVLSLTGTVTPQAAGVSAGGLTLSGITQRPATATGVLVLAGSAAFRVASLGGLTLAGLPSLPHFNPYLSHGVAVSVLIGAGGTFSTSVVSGASGSTPVSSGRTASDFLSSGQGGSTIQ